MRDDNTVPAATERGGGRPPSYTTSTFNKIVRGKLIPTLDELEAKVLLVYLCHAVNGTGEAWPSVATVASMVCRCPAGARSRVRDAIHSLVAKGLLFDTGRLSEWGTKIYRLVAPGHVGSAGDPVAAGPVGSASDPRVGSASDPGVGSASDPRVGSATDPQTTHGTTHRTAQQLRRRGGGAAGVVVRPVPGQEVEADAEVETPSAAGPVSGKHLGAGEAQDPVDQLVALHARKWCEKKHASTPPAVTPRARAAAATVLQAAGGDLRRAGRMIDVYLSDPTRYFADGSLTGMAAKSMLFPVLVPATAAAAAGGKTQASESGLVAKRRNWSMDDLAKFDGGKEEDDTDERSAA